MTLPKSTMTAAGLAFVPVSSDACRAWVQPIRRRPVGAETRLSKTCNAFDGAWLACRSSATAVEVFGQHGFGESAPRVLTGRDFSGKRERIGRFQRRSDGQGESAAAPTGAAGSVRPAPHFSTQACDRYLGYVPPDAQASHNVQPRAIRPPRLPKKLFASGREYAKYSRFTQLASSPGWLASEPTRRRSACFATVRWARHLYGFPLPAVRPVRASIRKTRRITLWRACPRDCRQMPKSGQGRSMGPCPRARAPDCGVPLQKVNRKPFFAV